LADNDTLYTWFSEKYEKTEEKVFIYVDTLYDAYCQHTLGKKLSPEEQKNTGKKDFMKSIASNVFLSPYHKIKNQSAFGKRLNKPAVIGFKLIKVEEELNIKGCVIFADNINEL